MEGDKRTTCEINCRLVDISSKDASNSRRLNIPTGPPVYPLIQLPKSEIGDLQQQESVEPDRQGLSASEIASGSGRGLVQNGLAEQAARGVKALPILRNLWPRGSANLAPPETPPIAWHLYQQRLAVVDSADRVHVFDIGAAGPSSVGTYSSATSPKAQAVLQHDHNYGVTALAWRPNSNGMLAVAGQGGVSLWNVMQAPISNHRPMLLPAGRPVQFVSLSWNPTGSLLAAGHANAAGFTIWDVALGTATSLSAGQGPTPLLQWSLDGSKLLCGGMDGSFHLWDTERWGVASWQTPGAGSLVGACWSPDSRSVLLAFANSKQLAMLYLLGQAPSLQAQLLPVQLPELEGEQGSSGTVIGSIDWDTHGERLAVAVGPGHAKGGTVALYATSYKPVMSVRFIGYAEQGNAEPGKPAPVISFHKRFDKGALLAVRGGGDVVSTIPLLFRPGGGSR